MCTVPTSTIGPREQGAGRLGYSLLIAGTVAWLGCSPDPSQVREGNVDTLANGAPSVSNPRVGQWTEETAWTVTDSLRIGSLDNELSSFGRISSITVDRTGNIYVLELGAGTVRVFDHNGDFVQEIGARGAGPGEIRSGVGVAIDGRGRLWVADAGNVRYAVFDARGQAVTSLRWTDASHPIPRPLLFDADGYLVGRTSRRLGRTDIRDVVVRLDSNLQVTDDYGIPHFEREVYELHDSEGRLRQVSAVPFSSWLNWTVDRSGAVWIGINDTYSIVRRSVGGDTLLVFSRDVEDTPVRQGDLAGAMEEFAWYTEAGGDIDQSRIPGIKPHYQSIHVDDASNCWVRRFTDPNDRASKFDVFDPDGFYLGEISLPYRLEARPSPLFQDGAVYGVELDDLDVPYVVRVSLSR